MPASRQLPFEMFRPPCPTVSNGQPCRYHDGHDPYPCTFGGGLGDPVHNRHCDDLAGHDPHAWTETGNTWFNCTGRDLTRPGRATKLGAARPTPSPEENTHGTQP